MSIFEAQFILTKWIAKHAVCLIGLVAIAYPLILLFNPSINFAVDWFNHLWLIGYYGKYFAAHGTIPLVLNTTERLLIAYPTFYGFLFYPVLGAISSVTGPDLAIRLAVGLLWVLKFCLAYQLTFRISKSRQAGILMACLCVWQIYPLTNLYNRSALTELFATGLLTCTLCSFLLMVMAPTVLEKIFYLMITGIELSLALASHPITALYAIPFGGMLLIVMIPFVLRHWRKAFVPPVILGIILFVFVFLTITPWVYATMLFGKDMQISSHDWRISSVGVGIVLFPDDIDNVFTRFAFFPYDPRSLSKGLVVSTPYLDAQVDMALGLVLAALVLFGVRPQRTGDTRDGTLRHILGKALFAVSLIMFVIATFLSLSNLTYPYLPAMANLIQFAYRFVTYQNLMLFTAVLSLMMISRFQFRMENIGSEVLVACLTLAAVGVGVKLTHGMAITEPVFPWQVYSLESNDESLYRSLPPTFYGLDAYTVQFSTQVQPEEFLPLDLSVGQGKDFGDPLPFMVYTSQRTWMQTNIAASPWNSVVVDGVPVTADEMRSYQSKLMVQVNPGGHLLEARFMPDMIYVFLQKMSFTLFLFWFGAALFSAILFALAKIWSSLRPVSI